jgi:hypothetical protein
VHQCLYIYTSVKAPITLDEITIFVLKRKTIYCSIIFEQGFGGKNHLEDRGVEGKMASEWILGRLPEGCGVDSAGSG